MKNAKLWMHIAWIALLACSCLQSSCKKEGGKPARTNTTFNRRFIPTIKPMMSYEQIAALAGAPGVKIEEHGNASPSVLQYRWNGSRDSVLTVKLADDKMIEATILAPNRHTYLIQSTGEVTDITNP
jgi:hypothetical protein